MKMGVPEPPSVPAVAAMPSGVPVARISNDDVAPLHEMTRQLQAQLEQWEEAVLQKQDGRCCTANGEGWG